MIDQHTEHCCAIHGCKYGDGKSCPVVSGKKTQSFICEDCEYAQKRITWVKPIEFFVVENGVLVKKTYEQRATEVRNNPCCGA